MRLDYAKARELNIPKLKSSYGPTVLIYLLYMAPSRVRIETTTLHVSIILLFEPIEYICDLLIQCSTAHLLPGNCQAPYLFLILNRTERRAKGPFFNCVDQILSLIENLPTLSLTLMNLHAIDTNPPLRANVIKERPLIRIQQGVYQHLTQLVVTIQPAKRL